MSEKRPEGEVQRATLSGARGYSANTDDELVDIEHDEQRIDPNREIGRGKSKGAGAGGMMPPMMGAGAGGAGAGGGGAAGLGASGAGAGLGAPFPGAGMPGAGNPAALAAGGAGVGAAGLGGAGLGGAGLGGAGLGGAGLGAAGLGAGIGAGMGRGGTLAAGAGGAGMGIDTDGDGIPDTFTGGTGWNGPGQPGGPGHPGTLPTHPGPWGPHNPGPSPSDPHGNPWDPENPGGGPGDGPDWPDHGGISSDADALDSSARGWAEIADRMASLQQLATQRSADVREFGLVTNPHGQYNGMSTTITSWSNGAAQEFGSMSQKLAADAQGYRDTASTQVGQTRTIHGGQ